MSKFLDCEDIFSKLIENKKPSQKLRWFLRGFENLFIGFLLVVLETEQIHRPQACL